MPLGMIGGALLSGGMGLLNQYANNQVNFQNAQQLQQLQIAGQKEMGMFNQQLNKDMWDYTNFENQRKHMEKAGLSVGLMYGGSGGGGATANGGSGNVSGQSTQQADPRTMGLMLGMEQQKAQIELTKAQAENVEANTEKTKGVDTAKGIQEIENLKTANVTEKAKARLTEMDGDLRETQSYIANASLQDALDKIKNESLYSFENLKNLKYRNQVDQATVDENIKIIERNYVNLTMESLQRKLNLNKTTAETDKIYQDINNSIQAMVNDKRRVNIEEMNQLWNTEKTKIDERLREAGLDQNERRLMLDTFRSLMGMAPTESESVIIERDRNNERTGSREIYNRTR